MRTLCLGVFVVRHGSKLVRLVVRSVLLLLRFEIRLVLKLQLRRVLLRVGLSLLLRRLHILFETLSCSILLIKKKLKLGFYEFLGFG